MYYFENMRLAEIAAAFSLTEGRISQIHTQAVMSLRTFVKRITNSEICF
jgi:RNA polymerase sigma factor for flagellar operon FliA